MALIDRVRYEGPPSDTVLVWRWPNDALTAGTQLIVNPGQEALLVKGGQALDLFGPGTYTLATANIPLLGKLINLPFGRKTPFTAEVYYINRHAKLDMKWGTPDPIRVTDPRFGVIVPVRSFGQMGIRVADARAFVTQLVGVLPAWQTEQLSSYLQGLLVTRIKDAIARYIVDRRVSVLEISARLDEISRHIEDTLQPECERFGVEVVNFYVMSINWPEEDESLRRVARALALRAEREQLTAGTSGDLEADPVERLKKLKSLLDAGLISAAEFAAKKKGILDAI